MSIDSSNLISRIGSDLTYFLNDRILYKEADTSDNSEAPLISAADDDDEPTTLTEDIDSISGEQSVI